MDLERVDRLIAEGDGIAAAQRTAMAFHQPAELAKEFARYQQRAALLHPIAEAMSAAEAVVKRLRAGKRVKHVD